MADWRYKAGGKVAHALLARRALRAACGETPGGRWRGDGSERERIRLANLRDCQKCTAYLDGHPSP